MPPRTILVVEDESSIANAVASRLRSEGFVVETAGDGKEALERFDRLRPDLVVLDLMLPQIDGLEVCRRMQAARAVPVLMLTARDTETDLVVGLAVGADDYMTKPFSPRELVARVHAILRRQERATAAPEDQPVAAGSLTLDPASRRACQGRDDVHLTPTEFDLLLRLARRPGVVFTREQLVAEVWGFRDSGGRAVDTHVQALRRKLGSALIRTVHGVGYALEAAE